MKLNQLFIMDPEVSHHSTSDELDEFFTKEKLNFFEKQ